MKRNYKCRLWLRKNQSGLILGCIFNLVPTPEKIPLLNQWGQNYDFINVKKLIKASGFISVLHTHKDTHCFAQFHRETFGFSTHFKLLQSESLMVPLKIYFWIQQALSKLYLCLKKSNS